MALLVERTKVCANPDCHHAGQPQPWSAYYASRKWEDGTTRSPRSYCKKCDHARRIQHRIDNPDMAREGQKRRWARVRNDPAALADRNERRRFYHNHECKRPATNDCHEPLPSAPFAEWLRRVIDRDTSTLLATAERLGISDRTARAVVHAERPTVELATVERALIADGGATLRDVYPEAYTEAA